MTASIKQKQTKACTFWYFYANVPLSDIVNLYCTCVRLSLESCAPVFHHALPSYLGEDLERIQKRALNVISPGHSYCDNLARFGLKTLQSRRDLNSFNQF